MKRTDRADIDPSPIIYLAVVVIVLAIIVMIGIKSTRSSSSKEQTQYIEEYVSGEKVKVYVDPETKVEYLVWTAPYKGGITVRYNSDGTIRVREEINESRD